MIYDFNLFFKITLIVAGAALLTTCAQPGSDTDVKAKAGVEIKAAADISVATPYKFLAISDIHYSNYQHSDSADKYCDKCETTPELWAASKAKAIDIVAGENPDFIIVTGDLPAHRKWRKTGVERSDIMFNIEKEFETIFSGLTEIADTSSVPVILVPGNNDSISGDYCSFKANVDDSRFNGRTPFDLAPNPSNWPVNNGAFIANVDDLSKGYYSIYPYGDPSGRASGTTMRIIVLNTVIFTRHYSDNYCDDEQQIDSNSQLEWLSAELSDAESKEQKVLIAMHVPPGTDGFRSYGSMWSEDLFYTGGIIPNMDDQWVQDVFLTLVSGHESEIVGLLTGHTHLNGIRKIHSCSLPAAAEGTFIELAVSIPGITTDHGNQPGIKLIHAGTDFELMSSDTYFATVHTGSAYDWADSNVISFSENYPCTGAACNGLSMLARTQSILNSSGGEEQLLSDMLQYLKLYPDRPSGRHNFATAINVHCYVQYP